MGLKPRRTRKLILVVGGFVGLEVPRRLNCVPEGEKESGSCVGTLRLSAHLCECIFIDASGVKETGAKKTSVIQDPGHWHRFRSLHATSLPCELCKARRPYAILSPIPTGSTISTVVGGSGKLTGRKPYHSTPSQNGSLSAVAEFEFGLAERRKDVCRRSASRDHH